MKKLFENWQKHLNEGAVPHSAEHVVNKMRETGLSAKEALKSLTTNLSDEEADRWLERHKDEMDSHQEMSEGAIAKIPIEKMNQFKSELENIAMFLNDAETRAYHDLQSSNVVGPRSAAQYFEENPDGVLMSITPESAKKLRDTLAAVRKSLSRLMSAHGMEMKDIEYEKYQANKRFDLSSLDEGDEQ